MTNYTTNHHEARLQEVYRFLGIPRTVRDVAQEIGVHDQTAREMLWDLRDQGRAKETHLKRDRRKLWQASGGVQGHGVVRLITSTGEISLPDILGTWSPTGGTPLARIIGGCLAYLWRRAYYSARDQTQIKNVASQGTLDPFLQVRQVMEQAHGAMVMQVEALEQILAYLPQLWSDDPDIIGMIDPNMTPERVQDPAEWFEAWATVLLERTKK